MEQPCRICFVKTRAENSSSLFEEDNQPNVLNKKLNEYLNIKFTYRKEASKQICRICTELLQIFVDVIRILRNIEENFDSGAEKTDNQILHELVTYKLIRDKLILANKTNKEQVSPQSKEDSKIDKKEEYPWRRGGNGGNNRISAKRKRDSNPGDMSSSSNTMSKAATQPRVANRNLVPKLSSKNVELIPIQNTQNGKTNVVHVGNQIMIPVSVKTTCKHCGETIVAASMNEYKQHNCRATFEKRSLECKINNCGRKFFGSHSLKFHQKISHYNKSITQSQEASPTKDVLSLAMRDINNDEPIKSPPKTSSSLSLFNQQSIQEADEFKLVSPATQTPTTTTGYKIVASMEPMVEPISINTNVRNESHTSFLNSESLNLPTAHRSSANILRKSGRSQHSKPVLVSTANLSTYSICAPTPTSTYSTSCAPPVSSQNSNIGQLLVSCRNNLGTALTNSVVKLSNHQQGNSSEIGIQEATKQNESSLTNVINSDTIGHHDTEADFSDINFDSSPLKSSSADMIVSTVTLDAAGHHFMATTTSNSINQLIQNAGNALVENPPSLLVQNNAGTNMLASENQLMAITRGGGAGQFHGLVSGGSVVQGFIQQGGQNAVVTQEHLISLKTEENQEDDSLPADKESSLLYNYTLKEKEYPYKCTYDGCDKKYIRRVQYEEHTRMHTGERPYSCPACDKKFARIMNLKKHTLLKACQNLKSN